MNKLNVLMAYPNAKVTNKSGKIFEVTWIDKENGIGIRNDEVEDGWGNIDDFVILLRSLDDMTEEERKEFEGEYKSLSDTYRSSLNADETDWLREHNIETKYKGEDLIKKGWAKINNKIYEGKINRETGNGNQTKGLTK